jgi:D-3-phosphoglycerate dehydrogenase
MATKKKIKIVIVDKIAIDSLGIFNKNKFEVVTDFEITNDEILKKYYDFDVLLIRSVRVIDKKFIAKCSFKVIATCSKGFDNIDVAAAMKRKISVLNCEKGNSVSAAEHTMGLILAAVKNILYSDKLVRTGKFAEYNYKRSELLNKKIGIIGYGNVGSYVGKLSRAFGMKVYANDIDKNVTVKYPNVEFKNINFILKNCDIVTLHIPLSQRNFHFFDGKKLELLNEKSILVNTSRGNVIDEKELLRKLKRNELGYVCLDVFEKEPSPNTEFFSIKNTILTNHIAGKTYESSLKMAREIFKKIIKFYKY